MPRQLLWKAIAAAGQPNAILCEVYSADRHITTTRVPCLSPADVVQLGQEDISRRRPRYKRTRNGRGRNTTIASTRRVTKVRAILIVVD